MSLVNDICTDILDWLVEHQDPSSLELPSQALCDHVATCPRCRAALLLLMTDLLEVPQDIAATSCDQCQDDLAAYIDLERYKGTQQAIRSYPHVWWHLWVCRDCSETYRMVLALQEAEASGLLPPMPLDKMVQPATPQPKPPVQPPVTPPQPMLRHLTLPRIWFARMLAPQLGVAWGLDDEDETILHEAEDAGYHLYVGVHRTDEHWFITVTIQPPFIGEAVVTFGTESFRGPFDLQGVAKVGPIPPALLTSPIGPDMAIALEMAEG